MRDQNNVQVQNQLDASLVRLKQIRSNIDKGISMFEAAKSFGCKEYSPWNYNLQLGPSCDNKSLLDDGDGQELSNSMVDDLVAKVLDDETIVHNNHEYSSSFGQRIPNYQGRENNSSIQDCLMRFGGGANGLQDVPFLNGLVKPNDDYGYGELGNFNLKNNKENFYIDNGYANNGQRVAQLPDNNVQQPTLFHPQIINNDATFVSQRDYMPLTNGLSYNNSQTTSLPDNNCAKDLFGNLMQQPQPQFNGEADYNYNIPNVLLKNLSSIEMSDNIGLNELQLHRNSGINQLANNSSMSLNDSFNITANCQRYRPGSSMTNISVDSGFVSNSSLPPFSPPDCYSNNMPFNRFDEYNYHDPINSNMKNSMTNEQYLLKQNQFKMQDDRAEQIYDKMLNQYQQPCINDLSTILMEQKINPNILKMMNSPKGKYREKQEFFNGFYQQQPEYQQPQQQHSKMNYNHQINGCAKQFSNIEALKLLQQQQHHQHQNSQFNHVNNKRNVQKHLSNGGNFMDPEFLNLVARQRQQQQRMKSIPIGGSSRSNVFSPMVSSMGSHNSFPMFSENGLNLMKNNSQPKRSGPSKTLYLRLEQTYDQFKLLEKERKTCETTLTNHYPGKKVSSANNIPIPRLQGNPSRVDRLIIDHFREHARVITLVAKMERLRGASMNQQVHKAMENWLEAIKYVQECRKQEITNVNKRQKENMHYIPCQDEKDIIALANSIYKLTEASRQARTGMFNALQATLLYNTEVEKKVVESSQDIVLTQFESEENEKAKNSPAAVDVPATNQV